MISDAQLNSVMERIYPELRVALRAAMEGSVVHIFDLAETTHSPTGMKTKLVCFIAHQHAAMILEATAEGYAKSQAYLQEQTAALMAKYQQDQGSVISSLLAMDEPGRKQ